MRCFPSLFCAAPMVLAWVLLSTDCSHGVHAQETPAPEKKEDTDPKKLPPELETKLKELVDKAKVEKNKLWTLRMKQEISDIVKTTGLGEEGSKALEASSTQVVNASVDSWAVKSADLMRKQFSLMQPGQATQMLDQSLAQVDSVASMDWTGNIVQPFDQDDWHKALHQTLTSDQAAAWDKFQSDRNAAVQKEIGPALKNGVERVRQQQTQEILAQCTEIESTLVLPKDRSAKLEDLAKNVVNQTTEMWRKRVERMFVSMEDEQRHNFTRNGNIFIGTEETESPLQQTAWKEGLASLLTADETNRLKSARDDRKTKRLHALGGIMLILLDEKIAFTEAQRERLEPITDRLVKDSPQQFPDSSDNGYYSYMPPTFFIAAEKATNAELKPILDDVQLKRWRRLPTTNEMPGMGNAINSKPEEKSAPKDVEKAISLFLYDKTQAERKRIIDTNVLKAEDAIRTAGLNGEISAQLQAAALGTTENFLVSWKSFIEQQIRSQLQDVTPQNVRQRLDGIQDYFFQVNFGQNNQPSIWDETVKVALDSKQQDSWKKETDARTTFRDKTITQWAMEEFDRKNQITPEQWAKLEPLIAGFVHDDAADISQMFSPFNPSPWYLEGMYTLMPFAGVPDKDMKAILTKEQLDRWHGSPECTNATNLWQNMQIHKQRAGIIIRGGR
jgi:hypothetical protein